jgi:hypothetical protein
MRVGGTRTSQSRAQMEYNTEKMFVWGVAFLFTRSRMFGTGEGLDANQLSVGTDIRVAV